MKNRAKFFILLICVLAVRAEAGFRKASSKNATQSAEPTGEVPFEFLHSSLVVAKGSLNGIKGRNLLIDTGSDPTVLDAKTAQKLGVDGQAGSLLTLEGNVAGRTGLLSSVTMGPIHADSVPVVIADLSFMKKDMGMTIDAVIGLEVLKANDFTIDYESRRIVFGHLPRYRQSIPFVNGPPLLTVAAQINGEPKRLLVDTGAEGLFIFRPKAQEQVTSKSPVRNSSHVSFGSNRKQTEIPVFRLGEVERKRQPAYLEKMPDASISNIDGLLGPSALGVREVIFDFENGRLGWNY